MSNRGNMHDPDDLVSFLPLEKKEQAQALKQEVTWV